MITMKEYAEATGQTYDAVRKQVARSADQLAGHITEDRRVKYLDDEAVRILDERRQQAHVGGVDEQKRDDAQTLDAAKNQLLMAQAQIIRLQEDQARMMREREQLIQAAAERDALKLLADTRGAELAEAHEQIGMMTAQRDQALTEAGSYVRLPLGFYRRRRTVS